MSYLNNIKTLTKGKTMTKLDKIAKALGVKETQKIINLILELEYDYDRMSESGQETYEKLMTVLEIK
jgi:hypothetical protein|tara:strand:- start:198 stop:398 length:201 start_codon:yes stop_codon:yes gene_type:complete